MTTREKFIENLSKLHTTEKGEQRITLIFQNAMSSNTVEN